MKSFKVVRRWTLLLFYRCTAVAQVGQLETKSTPIWWGSSVTSTHSNQLRVKSIVQMFSPLSLSLFPPTNRAPLSMLIIRDRVFSVLKNQPRYLYETEIIDALTLHCLFASVYVYNEYTVLHQPDVVHSGLLQTMFYFFFPTQTGQSITKTTRFSYLIDWGANSFYYHTKAWHFTVCRFIHHQWYLDRGG